MHVGFNLECWFNVCLNYLIISKGSRVGEGDAQWARITREEKSIFKQFWSF